MFILIIYTAYFHCYKRECRNFKKKNGGENVLQIGELSPYETVLFPFEKAGFFGTFETAVFETFEFSFFSIRYIQTNKFMSYSIILVFKG